MSEQRIGSMVAVDATGRPLGIMTLHDVLDRVTIPQIDLDQPVIGIMSNRLSSLPPQALAHEAALTMAKHGFRHVLVVENENAGRIGVRERPVRLAARRPAPDRHNDTQRRICRSAQAGRDRHPPHGAHMMAQGVAPEQLTQFISTFNDLLTVRIVELEFQAAGLFARRCMKASAGWRSAPRVVSSKR